MVEHTGAWKSWSCRKIAVCYLRNMETAELGVRRKPRRLAKELVDALTERIRKRAFRPGDRLPTELQIMSEFGVSRTVVREAISGLQSAGLVETRHGIGTFVLEAPVVPLFRVDENSIPAVREILAMLELRISLESEAAALAAERRTNGQVKELRRTLDRFRQEIHEGGNGAEADFKFHLGIAEATGNHYFSEVLASLGTATIPRTRVRVLQSESDQAAYLNGLAREHEQIYEAILHGEPKSAAKSMRAHLSSSRERFRKAQEIANKK